MTTEHARHPNYPRSERPVLIGDTAHCARTGHEGIVEFVGCHFIGLGLSDGSPKAVEHEDIRHGEVTA